MELTDFFKIAEIITKIKSEELSDEILFRTAINRLYY